MGSETVTRSVQSIVLAGGSGVRLGMGPKAFVKLGDRTLLEIAIQTRLQVTSKVTIALPSDHIEASTKLVSDARVSFVIGGKRRIDTLRILVEQSEADWLLLHDVVHPFATVQIAKQVLETAFTSGAAAATLPLQEFLYNSLGQPIAKPGHGFIIQKPIAFRRSDMKEGFSKAEALAQSHDAGALEILALAGIVPSFVSGSPWNQKITHTGDLQIAEALNTLQS